MSSATPIKLHSPHDAATVLGVDYCTARGPLVNGQLHGFQIGRRWRVQPADIQTFIVKDLWCKAPGYTN